MSQGGDVLIPSSSKVPQGTKCANTLLKLKYIPDGKLC